MNKTCIILTYKDSHIGEMLMEVSGEFEIRIKGPSIDFVLDKNVKGLEIYRSLAEYMEVE